MTTRISAISMPTWGLTMEEGTLVKWLVPEGTPVTPDMAIAEIETTKVTNVLDVQEAGVLRRHVIREGETRSCGALIGVLAEESVPEAEIDDFVAQLAEAAPQSVASTQRPEPRWLELRDGRTLRYLRVGDGDTPALLIHGFGGDLDAWQLTQPDLAGDRAVYAIDLPGHGESAKDVGAGDLADLAETVVQAMDALGLEQAHLVGHSLGGGVAMQLALKHPARVASLALIAPAGMTGEIDRKYLTEFVAAKKTRDLQKCLSRLFADPAMASRDLVDRVARNKRLDGAEAALTKIVAACRSDRMPVLLPEFAAWAAENPAIPVMVIWGAEDAIVPHVPDTCWPTAVVMHVLQGAGHMPQLELAREVNTRLVQHLREAS